MRHGLALMQIPRDVPWQSVLVLVLAPALSVTFLTNLNELQNPTVSLLSKLLNLAGGGAALYFWHLLLTQVAPLELIRFRVNRSWAAQDWEEVVSAIQRLGRR